MRHRSKMIDDPFSDILKVANAQSVATGGFSTGGSWALRFPPPTKIKFSAVAKGSCWLCFEGEEPVRVEAGDVVLVSAQPRTFVVAGDLAAVPVDAAKVLNPHLPTITKIGKREDFVLIGGRVQLDATTGWLLADVLPPVVHVRGSSARATSMRWIIDELVREQVSALPGKSVACTQLAQLLFVHTLRAHLATAESLTSGWLRAFRDPRVAPALRLMHREPSRSWRVQELAKAAGMSRTAFALHFKALAGIAPLAYLTEWRMRLAEKALRDTDAPVAALAQSLGYTSESAFSNAFRRVTGKAPSHYRSHVKAASESLRVAAHPG